MKQVELYTALKSLGMPVAYGFFKNTDQNPAPSPPFITYKFAYNSDIKADDKNYIGASFYQIELYTSKKDMTSENLVQNKLKDLELPYTKVEAYLDQEKIYQIVYEIELIGG